MKKLLGFIAGLLILLSSPNIQATENNALTGTLSGKVTDKTDGQALIGVTISIPDLHNGAVTNADGKYVLNHVPKGVYLVQVRYIGYATITQKVDFSKTTVLNFSLQSSSIEANEVVVTGVSRATELKKSPIPVLAIDKTALEQKAGAGNVIDQIATLPGVSAVTTGPNISKPFIRGLGYNRVVTLQDGIRQEGQQWGDEHGIEVDQNSIDRIEVIKGPASLSYGSDAIGGVVNLLTAPPLPEGTAQGSVLFNYGTNNGLFNNSVNLQGNRDGLVWAAILSAKEAKNYQNAHDGRVLNTNFQERDARVMVGVNKSWGYSYFNASLFDDLQAIPDGSRDSVTRQFTKQITDADTYRPIATAADLNTYAVPTLHQHVQLYRIYNNSNFDLGHGNLLVNLGYQYSHRREYTHPTNPDIAGLNLNLHTLTYDIKYNFILGNDYETTVGVNGMYQTNTLGPGTNFPIPAYRQFDAGAFAVVKKTFNKLDLTAGARFDNRNFTGDALYIDTTNATYPSPYTGSNPATTPNVASQFAAMNKTFNGFSGSVGATYNFSNAFLIKANMARGFRAPSIAELSANGPDPGSQIYHIGNSSFKPEFSLQEDFGAFLTLPKLSFSAEAFYNNLQNYIFQQQVLDANGNPVTQDGYNEFTYTQTHARIYGGEFNLDIHPLRWLHFENTLALTYGENLGNGGTVADSLRYLPFIPPLHTHTELRANFSKAGKRLRNVYAQIGFEHYNPQTRYFAAYGTETYTAGYNLINAGFGGNLTNAKGKVIAKLFIEGNNLADVSYQSNMSRLKYFDNANPGPGVQPGIFNMGRNLSFKVILPFSFTN